MAYPLISSFIRDLSQSGNFIYFYSRSLDVVASSVHICFVFVFLSTTACSSKIAFFFIPTDGTKMLVYKSGQIV